MRKRITAPCIRKQIYTYPERYTEHEQETAALVCLTTCPFLKQCAKEALTAGSSVDGHVVLPARGVIAAGVICPTTGTEHGKELAQIAGVKRPHYRTEKARPRFDHCVECKTPMVSWNRARTAPNGYVMHHARGYCVGCRSVYREKVRQAKAKGEELKLPQFQARERPKHKEQVAWILRYRPVGVDRPARCIDCDKDFSDSTVSYGGRGLCLQCRAHWRDYIKAFGYRKNKLVA